MLTELGFSPDTGRVQNPHTPFFLLESQIEFSYSVFYLGQWITIPQTCIVYLVWLFQLT
jgi:hypothetical protein